MWSGRGSIVWSWGGLGGSCRTDLLRGPFRRRHRVRLHLRLDLTRCPYVLLVLGVIGVHCQLGFLVNKVLAQVHEMNEVTDSSVWSAILLLSIASPNTLIAAVSSFLLRQSILKISRTIAAFSSPPLRLAEAPALSRLALVKPSRELGISFSQPVDSSHFSPAASMTYTQFGGGDAQSRMDQGAGGGQGTREASLSLQSLATHLLRLLLPLSLRAV